MEDKLDDLKDIEAQRSDLITKLEKIEAKKETVSNVVYEKVKMEYEQKLKKLDEKLTANVGLMKEELAHLKEEEKKIDEEEKAIRLDIEETELRYTVGEYDDESYQKVDKEKKGELNNITTKLQKVRERMKWIQDFLSIKEIEEKIEPKRAEEEVVKTAEQILEEKLTPEEGVKVDEDILQEIKPESGLTIDEHILEEKLTPEDMKLDELLVEEEAVQPEVTEEKTAKPEVSEKKETVEEPPKKDQEGITCPKCGHVNTPDSWYCQKCGAEIFGFPPT